MGNLMVAPRVTWDFIKKGDATIVDLFSLGRQERQDKVPVNSVAVLLSLRKQGGKQVWWQPW
jgi:hypothetical protein